MADPEVQYLEEQLRQVLQLSDELWYSLDRACRLMESEAWLGAAAGRFNDEVHGERNRLRGELSRAVEDARRKVHEARAKAG
ncbi:MAG: hypothetical protein GEV11_17340 [Streptosporangiales bacterium]|nr:hypothetical protein [Streptosporangiales bacterium]